MFIGGASATLTGSPTRRGKLDFDKAPPDALDVYNRSKLFFGMEIHRFCEPAVCPAGPSEPSPHVINSMMQKQGAYAHEKPLLGELDSPQGGLFLSGFGG